MSLYTFDRSPSLGLALVATASLRAPRYLALAQAPQETRHVDGATLQQLHAVANGVVEGLTARQRAQFLPPQWELLALTHPTR